MRGFESKLVSVARSGWEVGKRPQWTVVLGVLGVAAVASLSAGWVTIVLGLFFVLPFIGLAFGVLGVDPFSPMTVFNTITRPVSWPQLAVASVGIALTLLGLKGASTIPLVSERLARWTHGDRDLTTALLLCALAALGTWFLTGFRRLQIHWIHQGEPTKLAAVKVKLLDQSQQFWTDVAVNLSLATVALFPAAILANWAWNVIASAVLPIFLISVKDHHGRVPWSGGV